LIDRLAVARESATSAFEIYVSQVAHRTNALIKVLTLISTVVLPSALIVAFFSTSFTDIRPLHSPQAFWLMVVALLATPTLILLFLRRRHSI